MLFLENQVADLIQRRILTANAILTNLFNRVVENIEFISSITSVKYEGIGSARWAGVGVARGIFSLGIGFASKVFHIFLQMQRRLIYTITYIFLNFYCRR